jgi:hypothetical protein
MGSNQTKPNQTIIIPPTFIVHPSTIGQSKNVGGGEFVPNMNEPHSSLLGMIEKNVWRKQVEFNYQEVPCVCLHAKSL